VEFGDEIWDLNRPIVLFVVSYVHENGTYGQLAFFAGRSQRMR
jgi:hypothetical protein